MKREKQQVHGGEIWQTILQPGHQGQYPSLMCDENMPSSVAFLGKTHNPSVIFLQGDQFQQRASETVPDRRPRTLRSCQSQEKPGKPEELPEPGGA